MYNEMGKIIKTGHGRSGKKGNMEYNEKWSPRRTGKKSSQSGTNKNGPRNPRGLK